MPQRRRDSNAGATASKSRQFEAIIDKLEREGRRDLAERVREQWDFSSLATLLEQILDSSCESDCDDLKAIARWASEALYSLQSRRAREAVTPVYRAPEAKA